MTDTEALERWRQWARDFSGSPPNATFTDDDLRYLVIHEQEQRVLRVLEGLQLIPAPVSDDASEE